MLNIKITYCAVLHYTDRAVSLAADLLKKFEPEIETLALIPSDGGKYEIQVNDTLIYSRTGNKSSRRTRRNCWFGGEILKEVGAAFYRPLGRQNTALPRG